MPNFIESKTRQKYFFSCFTRATLISISAAVPEGNGETRRSRRPSSASTIVSFGAQFLPLVLSPLPHQSFRLQLSYRYL
jgi:hypothetical protein